MRKILSSVLAIAMLAAATAFTALADEANEPQSHYSSVTGTVAEVEEYFGTDDKPIDGWFRIRIEDADENPATLIVTDTTVYPFESEISEGDIVTGYFPANMPMLMIYPPQYTVYVLAIGVPDGHSVAVDRFSNWQDGPEDYLVSDGNMLAFRTDEQTVITAADGTEFDGDLNGRDLAVIYDVSTRSIPAQTTALEVIVLEHEEIDFTPAPAIPDPETEVEISLSIDVSNMPIIVNGEEISAPAAFTDSDGNVMVPLRAIAEALGFEVAWNEKTQGIELDGEISLAIGRRTGEASGVEFILPAPPVIENERTFIPLSFFKSVAGMNNAYVFEGQIVVDRDGEIME